MPEGHSIHRLAAAFRDGFAGQRLAVTSPQGRFADGAALLDGAVLSRTQAWGKHLFLGFEHGGDEHGGTAPGAAQDIRWLHVHLGLYGAWTFAGDSEFAGPHAIGAPRVRIAEEERALSEPAPSGTSGAILEGGADREWQVPEPRGQVRVRLVGEHGVADLTGPTRCEVLDDQARHAVVGRLGPDPLLPDADGAGEAAMVAAIRGSRTPVGVALMDQAVLAGVGNIYRAELLFRARLHPRRPGEGIAARTLRALWRDAVRLMADGVATGRIVTTDPADREVAEDSWYVYHRDGRPCLRCGTRVQVGDLASRRVYWCPRCQRMR
ncbi:Fpg/Nei family DNA glycosylase [Serinibacter salmoneus]|uniref:DNA-(apurinic or apyrimidinic site) lyase n=1 Tax=Serinibacter salmoneus TaxID=556530 RepID=A0A2A9CZW2_9MICO|nr:DNA lyase [Serinibacter salmoneus]PFG19933.1 endonuclease-8/formamidopyrimidine-DNA glycosylase [Serinibacter salmoneus]